MKNKDDNVNIHTYTCIHIHIYPRAYKYTYIYIHIKSSFSKYAPAQGFSRQCDALIYLLDMTFIRFGTKLHRQIVGIPMGTNCAPLVADLVVFCYKRDFMMSLSNDSQADVIEALHSTSRYLDDLLNIDNPHFE